MEGGRGGERRVRRGTLHLNDLPQECVDAVLAFISPRDACSLSLVSTTFKSVAESDSVWESFLPSDYRSLIPASLRFSSKKQLYRSLCENPVLIDGGRKSFSLEKGSGKKCYMLSARDLFIVWSDTPAYWIWVSVPESRFEEVAQLINVCWFEIRGKISISMLSPMTHYKAYFVFKKTTTSYGFDFQPMDVSVGGRRRTAYLIPQQIGEAHAPTAASDNQNPKVRADGWKEIELGEFFNDGCVDGELEMSVLAISGHWKRGIVVQGIEIRPNPCAPDS